MGTGFIAIAGGWNTGYALRANGSVVAWGGNWYGEVSNVPDGTGFTYIAGGGRNGYVLTPEPCTLLLLGLGAVTLRRKR